MTESLTAQETDPQDRSLYFWRDGQACHFTHPHLVGPYTATGFFFWN